jgi:hypothetical protein
MWAPVVSLLVDESLARLALAGDDVEHAGREARLGGQVERLEYARARVLGRRDDDRVPGCERRCERVHRQQHRRVPGNDDPDDAEGLAERVVEDARPVERNHAALHLVREPAEVVEPVWDHPQLGEHLLVELAVVRDLDPCDLLRPVGDHVRPAHHQPAAACGGEPAPRLALERGRGGADGAIDVRAVGERMLRPGLAGGRVEGVEGRAGGGVDVLGRDVQGVSSHAVTISEGPARRASVVPLAPVRAHRCHGRSRTSLQDFRVAAAS